MLGDLLSSADYIAVICSFNETKAQICLSYMCSLFQQTFFLILLSVRKLRVNILLDFVGYINGEHDPYKTII